MTSSAPGPIHVDVEPTYLEAQSDPASHHWVFAYTVTVTNRGPRPAQLIARHWIITDARGHREEVRGAGVVGEQPVIAPGEHFRYTSYCPLTTSLGTMEGRYFMVDAATGERFEAEIPTFVLVDPGTLN